MTWSCQKRCDGRKWVYFPTGLATHTFIEDLGTFQIQASAKGYTIAPDHILTPGWVGSLAQLEQLCTVEARRRFVPNGEGLIDATEGGSLKPQSECCEDE